jgi:hypothetical protein
MVDVVAVGGDLAGVDVLLEQVEDVFQVGAVVTISRTQKRNESGDGYEEPPRAV